MDCPTCYQLTHQFWALREGGMHIVLQIDPANRDRWRTNIYDSLDVCVRPDDQLRCNSVYCQGTKLDLLGLQPFGVNTWILTDEKKMEEML